MGTAKTNKMLEMMRNADCKEIGTEFTLLPVNRVQLSSLTNTAADVRLDLSAQIT